MSADTAIDGRKKVRCPHCQAYVHVKRLAKHIAAAHANAQRPTTVVDRIVEQNDALWAFLKSDGLPREERMALLRLAFPGSPALMEGDAEVPK